MTTKVCSRCGQIKQLSEFYEHRNYPDGRVPHCKACKRRPLTSTFTRAEKFVYEQLNLAGKHPRRDSWEPGSPDLGTDDGPVEVKAVQFTDSQLREFHRIKGLKIALVPVTMRGEPLGEVLYVDFKDLLPTAQEEKTRPVMGGHSKTVRETRGDEASTHDW